MEEKQDFQHDLASIRSMMEKSVKFISLSGLAGILAGIYALIGAAVAYFLVLKQTPLETYDQLSGVTFPLVGIAIAVLVASLANGLWLSARKAKRLGLQFWNTTTQRLIVNLAIPLVTGGLFVIILLSQGRWGLVAPACLIFYGLALIGASSNLFEEIRYLGYSEIVLGLLCATMPGYGLLFWSIGFGIFHVFYGALMFRKYDK